MEEIIFYKGGRGNGGVAGAVRVSCSEEGNVFVEMATAGDDDPHVRWPFAVIRFCPEIATQVAEAMIRMVGRSTDGY